MMVSRIRPDERPADSTKSSRSGGAKTRVKRLAKARGLVVQERSFANKQGATERASRQNEEHYSLLESYLRSLTEHRNNLHEYLRELGREREELERDRGDIDLKIEANEEKRERLTGYIEEIPKLRDKALRSLVKGMEELEDG
jgi:chromosome segregation ATPase